MIVKPENMKELLLGREYLEWWMTRDPKKMVGDSEFTQTSSKNPFQDKNDFMKVGDLSFQKHISVKKALTMINERLSKVSGRSELWLKHGFDTKFGSHLVRLMIEGKELLETGNLTFPLKEHDLLMDIKMGKFNASEVAEMSEHFENEVDAFAKNTALPSKPRYYEINQLCIELHEKFLVI